MRDKENETKAEDLVKIKEILKEKEKAHKMFKDSNGTNHLLITGAKQIYLKVIKTAYFILMIPQLVFRCMLRIKRDLQR